LSSGLLRTYRIESPGFISKIRREFLSVQRGALITGIWNVSRCWKVNRNRRSRENEHDHQAAHVCTTVLVNRILVIGSTGMIELCIMASPYGADQVRALTGDAWIDVGRWPTNDRVVTAPFIQNCFGLVMSREYVKKYGAFRHIRSIRKATLLTNRNKPTLLTEWIRDQGFGGQLNAKIEEFDDLYFALQATRSALCEFGSSMRSDSKDCTSHNYLDRQTLTYNFTFCLGMESMPKSMSHSLILAPMTSGWSSCRK
jgi:hypothetical protein